MRKYVRKTAIFLTGWGMIGIGFVGLFIPFLQGILLVVIGLYVLSFESVYCKRIMEKIIKKFPSVARHQKIVEEKYNRIFGTHDIYLASHNKKILTLCIIHQHPHVLLGRKKRGFGEGRWNGFGGKVSSEETIEEAAKREIHEEAGIKVNTLNKVGIIDFEFRGNPEILEVHVFRTENFLGYPTESEEMRPQWFHVDDIPFKEMWPDDKYWIPLFLAGKKFRGKFLFGESDIILEHELREVGEID